MSTPGTRVAQFVASHVVSAVTKNLGSAAPSAGFSNSQNHTHSLLANTAALEDRRVLALGIQSVSFMHQLQNIREGSQVLQLYSPTLGTAAITIPAGNYTDAQFATAFNLACLGLFGGGQAITLIVHAATSRIEITSNSDDVGLDVENGDRLLLNMLGFVEPRAAADLTHLATQPFNFLRDMVVYLRVQGANCTLESSANQAVPLSQATDTVLVLPLNLGFGAMHTWINSGPPAYLSIKTPRNAVELVWVDARGQRLPHDTTSQWVVSGSMVLERAR